MKTYNELFNAAKNKGFSIETFSTNLDRFNGSISVPETVISIEIKPNVWFTWIGTTVRHDEFNNSETMFFFSGRYNQNTGTTQNTLKKEYSGLFSLGLSKVKF